MCLQLFTAQPLNLFFSLEGNIKNNILLSETKLKDESQGMQILP